jgi:hypothetical protein
MWRVKRVLDEYKRLIKEHDVARLDQHRYVHMCGALPWLLPCLRVGYGRVRKRGTDQLQPYSHLSLLLLTLPLNALIT